MNASSSSSSSTIIFNNEEMKELIAICDTFFAQLDEKQTSQLIERYENFRQVRLKNSTRQELIEFAQSNASRHNVPQRVAEMFSDRQCVPEANAASIKQVLSLLSSRYTGFLLIKRFSRFSSLSLEERIKVLLDWSTSLFETKRLLFRVFKGATLRVAFSFTTSENGLRANPFHALIDYPLVDPECDSNKFKRASIFQYTRMTMPENFQKSVDVVVVGSGCGGGLVAGELAAAGYKVLVIEKGPYISQQDLSLVEEDAFSQLYEQKGTLSSSDGSMAILAGSCFGGGSTVNWACSLRTPHYVREEWASRFGLKFATSRQFQQSMDAICKRLNVTSGDHVKHDRSNSIMLDGCKKLGYPVKVAPQNIAKNAHHQCGWCCFGCRYGEKQSSHVTYLKDAAQSGNAKFLWNTTVDRVVVSPQGKAIGVRATINETGQQVVVHAKVVVSSCGALQTPALLLRSGVKNPNVGKNLRLHPVTGAFADFEHPVRSWSGAMMTTVCKVSEAGPDHDYYGAKLECPIIHPGLSAAATPWQSPTDFKLKFLTAPYRSSIIVLQRDSNTKGRVSLDPNNPYQIVVDYTVNKKDRRALIDGLLHAIKILHAAGARSISCGLENFPSFEVDKNVTSALEDDPKFKQWWQQVVSLFSKSNRTGFFSAHQMGTAKMATSPSKGVCSSIGEVFEVENLFVADTSLFPTPSGANPMITCYALSHYVAQHIKSRLHLVVDQSKSIPYSAKL